MTLEERAREFLDEWVGEHYVKKSPDDVVTIMAVEQVRRVLLAFAEQVQQRGKEGQ